MHMWRPMILQMTRISRPVVSALCALLVVLTACSAPAAPRSSTESGSPAAPGTPKKVVAGIRGTAQIAAGAPRKRSAVCKRCRGVTPTTPAKRRGRTTTSACLA